MGETVIDKKNERGRYSVPPAKNAQQKIVAEKNVEIDLGNNNAAQYAVITKDMDPKPPAEYVNGEDRVPIQWFAAFGIRIRNNTTLGDFAQITYTVFMDALPAGKRLFLYHGGKVHEVTDFQTSGTRIQFSRAIGDPPIGYGP